MNPVTPAQATIPTALCGAFMPFVMLPLLGLITSVSLVPIVRILATRLGAVDEPGARRVHVGVVPRLGGVGVFVAFWFGVAVAAFLRPPTAAEIELLGGFAVGSLILFVVAVYDDLRDAPAWLRFCFQFLAAHLAHASGFQFHPASFLRAIVPEAVLGPCEYGLTLLWISGLINALNFMDGLDFLCVGVSLVTVSGVAFLSYVTGQVALLPLYLLLIGVLIGFGLFNRSPASIFLGDSGATFLGFFLACFSLHQSGLTHGTLTFLMPLVLLAIPLFDTTYAIGRRLWLGVSPFSADRGHLHHHLQRVLGTPRRAVDALCLGAAICGAACVCLATLSTTGGLVILGVLALASAWVIRRLGLFDPDVVRAGRCKQTWQADGAGVPTIDPEGR